MPNSEMEMMERARKFEQTGCPCRKQNVFKHYAENCRVLQLVAFATLERAEARREAIEECIKIAKKIEDVSDCEECVDALQITEALRSKLAAPEKEETNG